jgi:hypothetical protein
MYTLLLSSVLLWSKAEAAQPAAMVLSTHGAVTVQHGQGAPRKLSALALLHAGDRLAVAAGADARVVILADGHRERLKPGAGPVTVGEKGCGPAAAVERLPGPKLSPANLASLRGLGRSSRGGVVVAREVSPCGPPAVTPMYATAVLTGRPDLAWSAADRADSYLVEMFTDARPKDARVLWKAQAREPHLAYPPKERLLAEGGSYRWRVQPVVGKEPGEPVVESKFSVLPEQQRAQLAGAEKLAAGPDAEGWLLAAILYEAHRAYDQALPLYERLAKRSPGEPAFQLALASYYTRAGREDQARAARARARKLGAAVPED